jgi:hypothetical protein
MSDDQNTYCRQENLRLVYEQRWLHARHQENQRLTFTKIFFAIYGIILAYSYSVSAITKDEKLIIFGFLAILSILGFLLIRRWNEAFLSNRTIVRRIHHLWHIPDISVGRIVGRKFFTTYVAVIYVWFYVLCFGFSLSLILNVYFPKFIPLIFFLFWLLISVGVAYFYNIILSHDLKLIEDYYKKELMSSGV